MVTVCVSQPGYFQRLHYFARMYESDVFVSLAGAQISRRSGQCRAELDGQRLTVPVCGGNRQALLDVIPDYASRWTHKHAVALERLYGKAPMYKEVMELVVEVFLNAERFKWSMASLGIALARVVMERVAWKGKLLEAGLRPDCIEKPSDWMLMLAEEHNADVYLCGQPAYDAYLDLLSFEQANIEVRVQKWQCPEYRKMKGGFVPNLSVLDALMYCTPEELIAVLKGVL